MPKGKRGDTFFLSTCSFYRSLCHGRQLATATTARLTTLAAGAAGFLSGPFVRRSLGVSGAAALTGNLALLLC